MSNLNPYQIEILQMCADGCSAKQIGSNTGTSPKNIWEHFERIRGKLNAKNMPHAVAIGIRQNIIK